jgi:hypothetical protein
MPMAWFDPPPAIDPREERGISVRYLAWWRNGAFDTGLTSAIGHISRAGHAESFFRAMRPAAAFH